MLFDSAGIKEVYLSCIITFYCFLLSPLFSSLTPSCSQWEENSYTLHSNILNFVSFHYANYFHLRGEWNWMVKWDSSILLFLAWIKPRIIFFSMSNWLHIHETWYQSELTIIEFLQICVVILNYTRCKVLSPISPPDSKLSIIEISHNLFPNPKYLTWDPVYLLCFLLCK